MGWEVKSILALVSFVPFLFLPPLLHKLYGIRPEWAFVLWFIGSLLGVGLCMLYNEHSTHVIIGCIGALLCAGVLWVLRENIPAGIGNGHAIGLIAGFVFGTLANILFFQAMIESPSPVLPAAIVSINVVLAALATPLQAQLLPQVFPKATLRWRHDIGIALSPIVVWLIAIK